MSLYRFPALYIVLLFFQSCALSRAMAAPKNSSSFPVNIVIEQLLQTDHDDDLDLCASDFGLGESIQNDKCSTVLSTAGRPFYLDLQCVRNEYNAPYQLRIFNDSNCSTIQHVFKSPNTQHCYPTNFDFSYSVSCGEQYSTSSTGNIIIISCVVGTIVLLFCTIGVCQAVQRNLFCKSRVSAKFGVVKTSATRIIEANQIRCKYDTAVSQQPPAENSSVTTVDSSTDGMIGEIAQVEVELV